MKKSIYITISSLTAFCAIISCSSDDSSGLGGCTVGCGVVGLTGYSLTEYKFISKSDCEQKKEESAKSCRVVYCPPTGNSDDCVEF